MKKKLFFTGMLVCVLAFGMAVVGCGGDDEKENTDPKTIVITGLTGKSGYAYITGFSSPDADSGIGSASTIAGDAVEFPLYNDTGEEGEPTRWTGTGSYYLMLSIASEDEGEVEGDSYSYVYTNGASLKALGVSGEEDIENLPKYSITVATSTIPLSKFAEMPTGE